MTDHRIETKRLILRRIRSEDAKDLHAVFTRADAMRYWSTLPHTTFAQTEDWVYATRTANPDFADDFVVELRGRVIGKAGIWDMPEIGIILHPDHWGQGLATEALTAVIDDIFGRRPDLEQITADVDPRNGASLALLAKTGFQITGHAKGTFQLGDELCDSTYLEVRRAGWNHKALPQFTKS